MEVTIRRPDVVKPDAKLLQEAYELAAEVYDMEPWIDFIEELVAKPLFRAIHGLGHTA